MAGDKPTSYGRDMFVWLLITGAFIFISVVACQKDIPTEGGMIIVGMGGIACTISGFCFGRWVGARKAGK